MEQPLTLVTVVDGPTAAPGGGGSSMRAAAAQLSPDVMHQCKLSTGEVVLVRPCNDHQTLFSQFTCN